MYRVFSYDGKSESILDKLISDDRVQTLSITRREGKDLGIDGKIVIIEGNDEKMKEVFKAVDFSFLKEINDDKKRLIYEKVKEENDEAAGGLGFVFQ
jgi:predicted nucleic acid-binding OB-fold protein